MVTRTHMVPNGDGWELALKQVFDPKTLKKGRKYVIVGIFLVAAILTPPDVVSQIMLAVPLLLLYEIGIWISAAVEKKREREMGMEEAVANEA